MLNVTNYQLCVGQSLRHKLAHHITVDIGTLCVLVRDQYFLFSAATILQYKEETRAYWKRYTRLRTLFN